jgi:hypothetical protein
MTKRILGVSMTSQLLVGSRTYISIFSMTIILLGLQALPAFESWTYLLQCVVLVASGALTYTATHVLMWLAQKKPHGGEEIVIKFAGAIIEKILNKAKGAST